MSLSNEHAEMTILLASFPLKADGNIVTNYDCDGKLHSIRKEQFMT